MRWGSMWLEPVCLCPEAAPGVGWPRFPGRAAPAPPPDGPQGPENWPGGSVDGGSVLSREPKETDSAGPWEGPAPRTGNNAFY